MSQFILHVLCRRRCISIFLFLIQMTAYAALPPLKVVHLGDSYSAGNGARTPLGARNYEGVSGCYRSPTNWGSQFVDSLRDVFSITYINRACSGGVINDISNPRVIEKSFSILPCPAAQYPDEETWECTTTEHKRVLDAQIDAVDRSVDLVVMTGGGNDVHFAEIVKQCFIIGFRDPADCRTAVEFAQGELVNVEKRLIDIFAALRKKLRTDARIAFVTYPNLVPDVDYVLNGSKDSYEAARAIRVLGLEGDARQRAAVEAANAAAGEDYVVLYDGTKNLFEGHLPNPFTSQPRNPDRWLYEAETTIPLEWYHYNSLGHQNLGRALSVLETFGASGGVFNEKADVDVAFVVDTTGSMGDEIAEVRSEMKRLVAQLASTTNSFRVAVVSYRDYPERTGDNRDYPSRVDQTFTDNLAAIQAGIDALTAYGGGDYQETVFSGIETAIKLPWRPGVNKIAVVIGDAPALSPEPISNLVPGQVVADSIAVDPVQVFGINVGGLDESATLTEIASGTGGEVVEGAAALTATISSILDTAARRPYAWLGAAYAGKIGEAVEFDATGSYDPMGGDLTLYEWDFDADGAFELESTEPKVRHTFSSEFNDFVVVRVTGTGGTALASARTVVNAQGYAPQGDENPCNLDESGNSIITDENGQFIGCKAINLPIGDKKGVTEGRNLVPVANAGADVQGIIGQPVTLLGSGSDPDSGPAPLTYAWTQVSGPVVTLSGENSLTPSFTPTEAGTYVFQLVAQDGKDSSAPDTVTVTVPTVAAVAIRVLQPNGGETWKVGSWQTIKWSVSPTLVRPKVPASIWVSKDAGRHWWPIGIDLRSPGSYTWKPGRLFVTEKALVKVCTLSQERVPKPVCDASDATFSIVDPKPPRHH